MSTSVLNCARERLVVEYDNARAQAARDYDEVNKKKRIFVVMKMNFTCILTIITSQVGNRRIFHESQKQKGTRSGGGNI